MLKPEPYDGHHVNHTGPDCWRSDAGTVHCPTDPDAPSRRAKFRFWRRFRRGIRSGQPELSEWPRLRTQFVLVVEDKNGPAPRPSRRGAGKPCNERPPPRKRELLRYPRVATASFQAGDLCFMEPRADSLAASFPTFSFTSSFTLS